MADELSLTGLDGSNPIAFMAALGLLGAADRVSGRGVVRLAWSDRVSSTAQVTAAVSSDELVSIVLADLEVYRTSVVLNHDGVLDVKFAPDELRDYIEACGAASDGGRSAGLVQGLVAEGSFDRAGVTKPTDLHFAAGQQKLLRMVREIASGVTGDDIRAGMLDEWAYTSELPSLGWDVGDDRVYALSASNPSSSKKRTMPGVEWLAVLGLSSLPVFRAPGRTATTACRGSWKAGRIRWPLWSASLSCDTAASLVATADRVLECAGFWTVHRLMESRIRRSEQGGYGSFSPAEIVWERS